ncbi:MAG: Nif3-like dinuclear metal center hexameric protein [bacterium]|nr:Nif3-like dinuclear metal center hexameric protein [bacterium]MDW8163328.1 Nif3-like dinuclear metal center hexameric protein [Candidatus Omnitrophota bacterium]
MKAMEFFEFIKKEFGEPGSEEGFRFNYYDNEITGIIVAWMVSEKILKFMKKKDFNLLITHEDLYFPPEYVKGEIGTGVVSEYRKKILDKYKINFIRLHYTIDKHFIFDTFDDLSGGNLIIKDNFYRIYQFENIKLKNLALKLKRKYKVKYLRITKPDKKLNRVGCLLGGLGLSINSKFIDKILSYNIDGVIAGEVDEYSIRALDDLNIGIIEIGHEASETPGLIKFTEFLTRKFPNIPVKYIKNSYPVTIFK